MLHSFVKSFFVTSLFLFLPFLSGNDTASQETPMTDMVLKALCLHESFDIDTSALSSEEITSKTFSSNRYKGYDATHIITYNVTPRGSVGITTRIREEGNPDAPKSIVSWRRDQFTMCTRESSFTRYVPRFMVDDPQGQVEYSCESLLPAELYAKKCAEFKQQLK